VVVIALGAFVKVSGSRYLVGFAWVEDGTLIDTDSFPAPADRDEAGQLGELWGRTAGVIAEASPDLFVLKPSEIARTTANAVLAHRAEGVVLAAASRPDGIAISLLSRQNLAKYAGTKKNTELVQELCGYLDRMPAQVECQNAATGAVGALMAAGALT
jgi:hypothetical protein